MSAVTDHEDVELIDLAELTAEERALIVDEGKGDERYAEALAEVLSSGIASIAFLQRELLIGYNRATKLIAAMEAEGYVTAPDGLGRRKTITDDSQSSDIDLDEVDPIAEAEVFAAYGRYGHALELLTNVAEAESHSYIDKADFFRRALTLIANEFRNQEYPLATRIDVGAWMAWCDAEGVLQEGDVQDHFLTIIAARPEEEREELLDQLAQGGAFEELGVGKSLDSGSEPSISPDLPLTLEAMKARFREIEDEDDGEERYSKASKLISLLEANENQNALKDAFGTELPLHQQRARLEQRLAYMADNSQDIEEGLPEIVRDLVQPETSISSELKPHAHQRLLETLWGMKYPDHRSRALMVLHQEVDRLSRTQTWLENEALKVAVFEGLAEHPHAVSGKALKAWFSIFNISSPSEDEKRAIRSATWKIVNAQWNPLLRFALVRRQAFELSYGELAGAVISALLVPPLPKNFKRPEWLGQKSVSTLGKPQSQPAEETASAQPARRRFVPPSLPGWAKHPRASLRQVWAARRAVRATAQASATTASKNEGIKLLRGLPEARDGAPSSGISTKRRIRFSFPPLDGLKGIARVPSALSGLAAKAWVSMPSFTSHPGVQRLETALQDKAGQAKDFLTRERSLPDIRKHFRASMREVCKPENLVSMGVGAAVRWGVGAAGASVGLGAVGIAVVAGAAAGATTAAMREVIKQKDEAPALPLAWSDIRKAAFSGALRGAGFGALGFGIAHGVSYEAALPQPVAAPPPPAVPVAPPPEVVPEPAAPAAPPAPPLPPPPPPVVVEAAPPQSAPAPKPAVPPPAAAPVAPPGGAASVRHEALQRVMAHATPEQAERIARLHDTGGPVRGAKALYDAAGLAPDRATVVEVGILAEEHLKHHQGLQGRWRAQLLDLIAYKEAILGHRQSSERWAHRALEHAGTYANKMSFARQFMHLKR